MAFASIHIPDFLIQALIRTNPALRQRAIALVDGTPPLCKVIAANETAFRSGIQIGMTKSQATQFCDIEIRHRTPAHECSAHAALLDLGWSVSPRIEDTQPDTILADVAGLASLLGSAANIAREFVARAALLGLVVNVAIASSIEAALLASHGFVGITLISPGDEARQLGDLPVEKLPATPETLEVLDRWGVRTCAALAVLPLLDLSERLGQEGVHLHELARGANTRALVLAQNSHHFQEEMALDDSVEDLEPLSFILGRLLDQLCARLNARALAVQTVHIRFELEPAFENGIQRLKNDSSHLSEKPAVKVYEKSLSLPVPIRDSKTLLKLLRLHLQSHPPGAPILKVIIRAEPAAPRSAQGGLFVPPSPDPEKLELTVARLANLVGESNIGSPELVDTNRPGEFRVIRFRPANIAVENRSGLLAGEKQRGRESASTHASPIAKTTARRKNFLGGRSFSSDNKTDAKHPSFRGDFSASISGETNALAYSSSLQDRHPYTAFRVFRPAPPAKVDLRNARPARVAFNGLLANVIVASGPWRTTGDWWRDDAWQQDEWDLELRFEHFHESSVPLPGNRSRRKSSEHTPIANHTPQPPAHGVYCLYFDAIRQGWFVRGIYD